MPERWKPNAIVALKSNPSLTGRVVRVSRNGKKIHVQFSGRKAPTVHSVEGLLLILPSPQLSLF